jgi:Tetratricopeptide repeat
VLNQDVLAAIAPADKAPELFGWLRGLPFVSQRAGSWAYHEVVRAAMLRLRRAEAPMEWRSSQMALAQANGRWAGEVTAGADKPWANQDWVDYTREETYHLLCADPIGNFPKALSTAVTAAEHSTIRARQWAGLIADAGRDADNPVLRQWGQRLRDGIHDSDLTEYLTCLITDADLDSAALVIAFEQRGYNNQLAGHGSQAIADLNRAIEIGPGYTWAIGSRGRTYWLMGRYDDALADAWAIAHRGEIYRAMGRYDEALADLNRVIELDPAANWAIAERGGIYRLMGRYDEALADFNRAIELDPSDDDYAAKRAEIHRLMGLEAPSSGR